MQSRQAREDLKAILDLQVKQKEVKIMDGSDIYNKHFIQSLKNISPSKLLQRKVDEINIYNTDRAIQPLVPIEAGLSTLPNQEVQTEQM
jgi:hypothetical protein